MAATCTFTNRRIGNFIFCIAQCPYIVTMSTVQVFHVNLFSVDSIIQLFRIDEAFCITDISQSCTTQYVYKFLICQRSQIALQLCEICFREVLLCTILESFLISRQ